MVKPLILFSCFEVAIRPSVDTGYTATVRASISGAAVLYGDSLEDYSIINKIGR
jgi:hypothetical protein